MAKIWQREPGVLVRLSNFVQVTITKRGAYFLRGERVFHLDDREAERFAEEWARFHDKSIVPTPKAPRDPGGL